VALSFDVTITYSYREGPSIERHLSLVVEPVQSVVVPLDPRASGAYVVVRYSFMGKAVVRAGRVELGRS